MLALNKYFFLVILLLFILLPTLTINPTFRIITFAAIAMLYGFIIVLEFVFFKSIDKLLMLILFFIGYLIVVGSMLFPGSITQNVQLFVFILLIHISWFIIMDTPKGAVLFLITILLFNFITISITIREILITPEVARIISNSNEISNEYVRSGVGGYGLVYSNVILFPGLIILFRMLFNGEMKIKHPLILKILVISNIVSVIFLILKAGYSIAVFLLIIQIGFFLVFKKFSRHLLIKLFILTMMVGIFVLLLITYQSDIRTLVSGTFYEIKFNDLLNSIYNESSEGTLGTRTELYLMSLETIKLSPIFGKLIPNSGMIGGHSTILDLTAKFGLLFTGLFIYIVFFVPLKLLPNLKLFKDEIVIVLVSLFVILLINRESMGFGIVFIFLASIYSVYINNNPVE